MSLRVFSLLTCLVFFGCDGSTTNNSTTSASSSGEVPIPPPKDVVWTATSMTDAPSPRHTHTAIWTGSKMIIWGGDVGGMESVTNTGGIYDPVTDTWKATSTANAPAPRYYHVAAWTGSKMLVWGGFGVQNLEPAGGIYDPETDTWAPMSTVNQPPLRTKFSAVWTGKKLVVWGGVANGKPVGTGGIYDLETDTWEAVNQAGAPTPRYNHRMAWSGKTMMLWGGNDFSDWQSSGALFDPEGAPQGVWTTSTNSMGAPPSREQHTLEFVHSVFVVWGGWNGGPTVDTGGMLDPLTNEWIATNKTGAPPARTNHVGIVVGPHLFVWGGCRDALCNSTDLVADGGQFVVGSDGGTWYPIAAQDALTARYSPSAVYTGDGVIVWGGRLDPATRTNTGAYAPL